MERDKLILSKLLFQIMIQKNFFFKARPGVSENDMRKGYKGFRECEKLSFELAVDKNGLPKPQAINTNLTNFWY